MTNEEKESVAKLFGANLRRLREKKGWLQTDLAKQLKAGGLEKYSQVAVSRTEEGNRTVRLDEALIIAKVLGVTIEQLLEPSDTPMRRLELLHSELNKIYSLRRGLIGAAREYEGQRSESKKLLQELRDSEATLGLSSSQKATLKNEMWSLSGAAHVNAVAAVRPHVLDNDGDIQAIREAREAKESDDGNDS